MLDDLADSLGEWFENLVEDYDYLTGYSLAAEWKKKNGDIPMGARLIPKQLFVLGGEFEYSNLMLIGDVRGMRSRGFFESAFTAVQNGANKSELTL